MIKAAQPEDAEAFAALSVQLWQDHDPIALAEEFRESLYNDDAACFLKYDGSRPIAFAQCQLRYDHVEGTATSPVGYLEGILVEEIYRKKGFASELLAECEK